MYVYYVMKYTTAAAAMGWCVCVRVAWCACVVYMRMYADVYSMGEVEIMIRIEWGTKKNYIYLIKCFFLPSFRIQFTQLLNKNSMEFRGEGIMQKNEFGRNVTMPPKMRSFFVYSISILSILLP